MLVRRLIAIGVGLAILFLILILFRACQDARKERGFDNYVRDMTAIATDSAQLSTEFFGRLADPGELTPVTFAAEIEADLNTAETLVQRVDEVSVPDQLSEPHSQIELAFELRRDAIANISDEIETALGSEGSDKAIDAITNDMRLLLASDVLYARARREVDSRAAAEGVSTEDGAGLPVSNFLPAPIDLWIDKLEVGGTLAAIAGDTGAAADGVHGVAIFQTSVGTGDAPIPVLPDQTNTIALGDDSLEVHVQVQNQGDSEETDLSISYELSGAGFNASGDTSIPRIDVGATETAVMSVGETPLAGSTLTLTVTVLPVSGELVEDNNESTYTLSIQ